MYILQLSDFHISTTVNVDALKSKIKRLLPIIGSQIPTSSQVVCCLLGDFSDKGNDRTFRIAEKILSEFQEGLSSVLGDSCIEYEIVPGNHDLCCCSEEPFHKDLSAFNEFASKLLGHQVNYDIDKPIIESNHFGYDFLAVSTVASAETSFGSINFDMLESCNTVPGSIVIAHHGAVSSDETDESAIRNGYRLHQFLENRSCSAFLHGHTHGYKRYAVGNGCQIIGVGPMFKNEGEYDISNQCNIVKITGGLVREIKTLIYHGDRDTWDVTQVYTKPEDNNYVDSDAYALYCRVLKDADESRLLPNLRIQIQSSFCAYEQSIVENFSLCRDDAIAWQSSAPNKYLECTHGQQMNTMDLTWQEFVVDALRQNPTTKRAIIPLIEREKAFHALDDQYLVSFDIVQVGFASNECKTLYITIYMRALEVRHFLPINLYETYLIAKTIKEYFPTVEELNICLFAYRAEAKKNYGCFKKAEIDILCESQLCQLLVERNYAAIIELLKAKSKMGDTVIDVGWLERLKNAAMFCYQGEDKNSLLKQVNTVLEKLHNLKQRRAQCSDYSITQEEESSYCLELEKLVTYFQDNL